MVHLVNQDEDVERKQPGHDGLFRGNVITAGFSAMADVPRKELCLNGMTIAFKERSTLEVNDPKKHTRINVAWRP